MNQSEASVSKSVSSVSLSVQDSESLTQGKSSFFDNIFPLFDQMMQKTKFPVWFLSLVAVFMLFQVLSITFWIYAPPFKNTSGKWSTLYTVLIKIFTFQDPLDFLGYHNMNMYLCVGVAVVSCIWIILMIVYNNKKYMIPTAFLYISSIIIDIVDPCFITPAVFVSCHGITSLYRHFDFQLIIEVLIGFVTYLFFVSCFVISLKLKSRSVVLTNLTFPLFDSSPITTWVITTSSGCLFSAIADIYDDWIYVALGVVHLGITMYVCYCLLFIPFYEVWRNSICLSIGITTCVLDINFFVLYAFPKFTFNYTIFIFVGCLLISYILTTIYFKKKVSKITNQLKKQENFATPSEYLDTLNIDKSTRKAMMYIVVGLATLGEYFVDGSLTDYIINIGTMESSISILLQVVTFFPSESRKMDLLFKKLFKKRKMIFADRFLIYQVYRIKLRRLMSDTKDTIETFNKLKTKNDQCKVVMRNFWDQTSADVSYLSSISIILNDLDSFFKYAISNNPNNLRIANEYADFLAECMTDFDKAIYQSVRAELIGNGRNFNVDISFRSVVNKFPRYLKDHILDTKGRRINLRSMNKDISTNASKSGSGSNSRDKGEGSSFSVDFELQEVVSKRLIRDSKVRLAFYHSIMGMKPIQATLIYFSALTLIVTCLSCYIGFVVNFNSRIIWRKNAYSDIRSAGYSLFFTFYANFITIMQWAKSTQRYDDNRAILGDLTINATTVKYIINDKFNRPQKIIYAVNFSRNSLTNLFNAFSSLANEYNVYDIGTNILRQECKLVVCDKNKPFTEITATVKDHILMMNFFQSSFAGTLLKNETIPNIYDNNDWCQVFGNSIILSEYSEKSLKSILDFNIKEADKYTVAFKTWMIAGSIAIIILSAGPALIIINTYNYHINKTLKMLLSLPTNIKEDAKKPIVITNQTEEEPLNAMTKAKVSKVMDYIAIGIFTLLFSDTAIFCVMCYRAIQANEELTDMYEWYYLSCVRVLSSTQAGNNAIHLLLLNGSLKNDIISLASLKAKALKDLDDLITADKALLEGNGEIKKIIGYDEQYDKLQLQEVCSLNRDPKSIHDMYACAGIGHQIIIFKNMVSDILNNPGKYDGVIDDEVSANIAHLLQYHFFPRVIAATTRMRDMIDERYAAGVRSNRLLLIGGLVISFIMEIMPWLFRYFVNENYKLLLICFKRIFPQAIVDTPEIMEFFKSSKKSSKEENMSISKSIVMDASECIGCPKVRLAQRSI